MALLLAGAAFFVRRCSRALVWDLQPYVELNVLVVDYTVPFDDYREHAGFLWLLDHHKIKPPAAPAAHRSAAREEPWNPALDYVGFRPDDHAHPRRLADVDRSGLQVIYVADTYGVYEDDLLHADTHRAHMDYSPLVFGGLSGDDAAALADFVDAGGLLLAEFNTFCEPTGNAERQRMQATFGLEWSGWVGRVFADPYDSDDVPHWLPREFARQYPGRTLPKRPILLLVSREGRLALFPGDSVGEVAPTIVPTPAGSARYPNTRRAPYYFWFSLMRARPGTRVYARLQLPRLEGVDALTEELEVDAAPPALTERVHDHGRALYFAGDFADIDFEPAPYGREHVIETQAERTAQLGGMTTAPAFWNFYAPIIERTLDEAEAAHAGARSQARQPRADGP